jgi:hypothetical protein
MHSQKVPVSVDTDFADRLQNDFPSWSIHLVRGLSHSVEFRLCLLRIGREVLCAWQVVVAVNRSSFVSVQPGTITCQDDVIGKGTAFRGFRAPTVREGCSDSAPLRSRLGSIEPSRDLIAFSVELLRQSKLASRRCFGALKFPSSPGLDLCPILVVKQHGLPEIFDNFALSQSVFVGEKG